MELSPAYVDVAIQRWQAFTGEEARLERAGEEETLSFAAVGCCPGRAAGCQY
jgi:DNA modification methylase